MAESEWQPYADGPADAARRPAPRTILIHLNVTVPKGDERDADEIAEVVHAALHVGSDDDQVRDLIFTIPLAEEV